MDDRAGSCVTHLFSPTKMMRVNLETEDDALVTPKDANVVLQDLFNDGNDGAATKSSLFYKPRAQHSQSLFQLLLDLFLTVSIVSGYENLASASTSKSTSKLICATVVEVHRA